MANWITPFWKQAFVTSGAALNTAQFGLSSGFVVAMIPQLRQPKSTIPIDDEIGSWLASVNGLTIIFGNMVVASIMDKYGRWKTSVLSLTFALAGWLSIVLSNSLLWLFIGRILQGINLSLIVALGPIIVGECTSPEYRGLFLSSLSAIMTLGTLGSHILSSYLHWRSCALVGAIVSFINLLISIYSPESPSWLANQGSYEDCKKTFRWLRGNDEEDELHKLIEATKQAIESKTRTNHNNELRLSKNVLANIIIIFKKKEVYKPIIISIHLFTLSYWSGLPILSYYPDVIVLEVAGKDINLPLVIISVDLIRLFANFFAMYAIKIFRRRFVLLVGTGLNVVILFLISGYTYARNTNKLPFEEPHIGIVLIHVHMFSIAVGALPLGVAIPGEIFPLEYRSMAMGFATTVTSVNIFITIKTFSKLVTEFNIYGSYLIYGIVSTYCLVVSYILVPETKDRTLQDIEKEFKGRLSRSEYKSNELFLKD